MNPPQHVYLIDGSGFIFRAYYGIKADMISPDGTLVNAVFGFTRMLMKLIDDTDADHIAVVFDRARKTFRSDIFPEYKANRAAPPEDLIPQFELVREATNALNVAAIDMEGYEADDLIATYTRQAIELNAKVTIVSSDKDLMQLVGPGVTMYDAMKNKVIGPDEVLEKFGVTPDRVIDVQSLAGDSSDNVPGVSGIGIKTAAELINKYGDLETLLEHSHEIKQPKRREKLIDEAEFARISRKLVTLKDDVPIKRAISEFAVRKVHGETLINFLSKHGFKSMLKSAELRYGIHDLENVSIHSSAQSIEKTKSDFNYELIQTEDVLERWILEASLIGAVAIDTETTSLDALNTDLVGVSLCIEQGRACYIPLGHKQPFNQGKLHLEVDGQISDVDFPKQIPIRKALKALKPLLENPSVLKVGQNIKFDMKVLSRFDISVFPIDDTMLLSYVLAGGLHGHSMDELALKHLDYKTIKYSEVTGSGKAKISFDRVALDTALNYAAEDADITLQLYKLLKPQLVSSQMVKVYETLERPLIPILFDMERTGIKVNGIELKRLSKDFEDRLGVLETEIYSLAGRTFNVASPKQLGEILFEELHLPGGKKGKTGAYTTGVEVLENLAVHGHKLPAKVLDWRQLSKLKSTYSDALIDQINQDTGRVHTSYFQGSVSTGRLASSNPNLQNIPVRTEEGRKIRKSFIADDGMVLLSADYSQIELRLLAHVAGIDTLKEAFHEGVDIHALTASQVFGVPVQGMDPKVRRKAKAINFGIIYGISAFGLARQLGIDNGEARDYIDAYFSKYPGIRDYMEQSKELARKQGFVTTLYGRKCHIKSINEKNSNVRGLSERAAINAPIQGGAADIIKRAMIRIPETLKLAGLKARMLLQVHDELIFEVPEKELDATTDLVKITMSNAAHLDVPLIVDIGVGLNWDEAH